MKNFLRTVPKSLRWGVFFGFAILIAGICFAAGVNIGQKNTGSSLTHTEFNSILSVLSDIRNDNGDIGIGVDPASGIELTVNGMMRVSPRASGDCESGDAHKGRIYFDSTDKHFYVCRGTASNDWVQLDN
jgi:hypothetical protein